MATSELIAKVSTYVENHMGQYDASHDFEHIKRVIGGAHIIYHEIIATEPEHPELDLNLITLSALLHDIGDRKYLKDSEDGKTMVYNLLISLDAPDELAQKVQRIVNGVSYTSELRNPSVVASLCAEIPELRVVQDADRLDAIGAVGIGRAFTYGGAKTERSMQICMNLIPKKLLKVEGNMKTEPGRKMAKERTLQLKMFYDWWNEDMKMGALWSSPGSSPISSEKSEGPDSPGQSFLLESEGGAKDS